MPIVTVNFVEGRSVETKRQLAKEITESICRLCDVPPAAVSVYMHDMAREDYAKGGVLYVDK